MSTQLRFAVSGLLAAFIVWGGWFFATDRVAAQSDQPQEVVCAQTVTVVSGDTLSAIAARTLGSYGAYPEIISATNAKAVQDSRYPTIENAGVIQVGWSLCIPDADFVAPIQSALPLSAPSGPTPTRTPTPTTPYTEVREGELHPLTIERMREQDYPGSDIVVEQVLAPGTNYNQYLTSYQSEGLKNYALLTIPQGVKPATGWPTIVFNHGYIPPEVYRTTERYIAYVDGFARQGYVVFRPDYRGHGFSEGFAQGGYGTPAYTVDVLNAVAALKQHPDVDADRMGMWGHSMGGHITLRTMVVTDDIKVGVIWAGVVVSYPDMIQRWRRPGIIRPRLPEYVTNWRDQLIDTYGSSEENPEFWASISPNNYVADLSGPIQLHHGTADSSVPYEFSEILQDEITAVGGAVEFYGYTEDNHNLSVNFNTAMGRSVAFFDQYLKN